MAQRTRIIMATAAAALVSLAGLSASSASPAGTAVRPAPLYYWSTLEARQWIAKNFVRRITVPAIPPPPFSRTNPTFQQQGYIVVVPTSTGVPRDATHPASAANVTCLGSSATQYTKKVNGRILRYRYYRDLECETKLALLPADYSDFLHKFGVSDLDIAVKADFTLHVLPTGRGARLDDLRFINHIDSDVTVISVQ